MRPREVRDLLGRHGLSADKGLGQHFLIDERVAERTVGYADPGPGETVLEVGPGLGVVTLPLARAAEQVRAVEVDAALAGLLRERLDEAGLDNVEVVHGDALEVDLGEFDLVCSNLPYQISSPLTFRLLEEGFDRAVLMYQREFADRLCAQPGSKKYGRLTVNASVRTDREVVEPVPRTAFWPRPEVDSALVRLRWRDDPVDVGDPALFADTVRALFMHRRKMARNAVQLHADDLGGPQVVETALEAWGMGDRRPGELSPVEIAALVHEIAGRR